MYFSPETWGGVVIEASDGGGVVGGGTGIRRMVAAMSPPNGAVSGCGVVGGSCSDPGAQLGRSGCEGGFGG
jgi:hypothetical protein